VATVKHPALDAVLGQSADPRWRPPGASAKVNLMSNSDGTELASRSDLEALRRSGRGKLLVLCALVAVALAAAAWSFLRQRGHGNPEDPSKVLVVAQGTTVGFSSVLRDGGFDAAEGTLSAWENKALDEIEGLQLQGVAAVLRLADEFGYGYVVFEAPRDLSWEGIDIKGGVPEFPEHVRFAVVSVGDFAFPHVMTLNPEPSTVMRDTGVVLLQALFEQERLARILPDNENPSIEDIRLRDRLQESLHRLARLPEAETMARKVIDQITQQLVDDERADPKPRLLAEPLESGNSIPLANGSVLTVSRGFALVTRDAVRADLSFDDSERFLFGAADDPPAARASCESLMGGVVSTHDSGRYGASADGAVLLVRSLSEGLVLWRLDTREPGCAFTRVGEISNPPPGISDGGIPHASGKLARTGHVAGQAVIDIVAAQSGERETLGMLDEVKLLNPIWIDDHTVAAVARSVFGDPDGLVFFSTESPMTVLRLDAGVFDDAGTIDQIAVVPGGDAVVVTAGAYPSKLYRLDLPAKASQLFAAPPLMPDVEPVERDALPIVLELDPGSMQVTALTRQGRVRDPAVSPDGRWVAVTVSDPSLDPSDETDDDEIALLALDGASGAKMRLLTRNALEDHTPRFSADSRFVIFQTRVEIPRTKWVITAPRAASVQ
jgi:hypothetical protein